MHSSNRINQQDKRQEAPSLPVGNTTETGQVTPGISLPGLSKGLVRQPLTAQQVIGLQKTIGNQAVNRLLATRRQANTPATTSVDPASTPTPTPVPPLPIAKLAENGVVRRKLQITYSTMMPPDLNAKITKIKFDRLTLPDNARKDPSVKKGNAKRHVIPFALIANAVASQYEGLSILDAYSKLKGRYSNLGPLKLENFHQTIELMLEDAAKKKEIKRNKAFNSISYYGKRENYVKLFGKPAELSTTKMINYWSGSQKDNLARETLAKSLEAQVSNSYDDLKETIKNILTLANLFANQINDGFGNLIANPFLGEAQVFEDEKNQKLKEAFASRFDIYPESSYDEVLGQAEDYANLQNKVDQNRLKVLGDDYKFSKTLTNNGLHQPWSSSMVTEYGPNKVLMQKIETKEDQQYQGKNEDPADKKFREKIEKSREDRRLKRIQERKEKYEKRETAAKEVKTRIEEKEKKLADEKNKPKATPPAKSNLDLTKISIKKVKDPPVNPTATNAISTGGNPIISSPATTTFSGALFSGSSLNMPQPMIVTNPPASSLQNKGFGGSSKTPPPTSKSSSQGGYQKKLPPKPTGSSGSQPPSGNQGGMKRPNTANTNDPNKKLKFTPPTQVATFNNPPQQPVQQFTGGWNPGVDLSLGLGIHTNPAQNPNSTKPRGGYNPPRQNRSQPQQVRPVNQQPGNTQSSPGFNFHTQNQPFPQQGQGNPNFQLNPTVYNFNFPNYQPGPVNQIIPNQPFPAFQAQNQQAQGFNNQPQQIWNPFPQNGIPLNPTGATGNDDTSMDIDNPLGRIIQRKITIEYDRVMPLKNAKIVKIKYDRLSLPANQRVDPNYNSKTGRAKRHVIPFSLMVEAVAAKYENLPVSEVYKMLPNNQNKPMEFTNEALEKFNDDLNSHLENAAAKKEIKRNESFKNRQNQSKKNNPLPQLKAGSVGQTTKINYWTGSQKDNLARETNAKKLEGQVRKKFDTLCKTIGLQKCQPGTQHQKFLTWEIEKNKLISEAFALRFDGYPGSTKAELTMQAEDYVRLRNKINQRRYNNFTNVRTQVIFEKDLRRLYCAMPTTKGNPNVINVAEVWANKDNNIVLSNAR